LSPPSTVLLSPSLFFLFSSSAPHPHLHSLPTRRSSDLFSCALTSSSLSPGSKNGGRPEVSASTLASSTSTPVTSWPRDAMAAACTAPRYPQPMTEILKLSSPACSHAFSHPNYMPLGSTISGG